MAQFKKQLLLDDLKLEFWFTGDPTYKRSFFVTVDDINNRFYTFHMKELKDGNWKIVEVNKVPSWILKLENDLSEVIRRNIKIENRGSKIEEA
jgi:hypothetical protein